MNSARRYGEKFLTTGGFEATGGVIIIFLLLLFSTVSVKPLTNPSRTGRTKKTAFKKKAGLKIARLKKRRKPRGV